MKQFFKIVFATMFGFILTTVLFVVVLVIIISSMVSSATEDKKGKVAENSILHITLSEPIAERSSNNPFENMDFGTFKSKPKAGLMEILNSIKAAKSDKNIVGIYLDPSLINGGMATVKEIRDALLDFKSSKKFIVSYSEGYTQKAYYLASVADKIHLNPQGDLDFKGLSSQIMFLKGAMEKLEIEPQIIRHGKFKSAIEPLILDKMSEANRKQTQSYMTALWNTMVDGISEQRKISATDLNEIANKISVQKPEDALRLKLVDKLSYYDEVLSDLKKRSKKTESDDIEFVELDDYSDNAKASGEFSKNKIAVIFANGSIESGDGDNETIGSETVSKAIRDARLDDKVKAIVLRVNSPGGSALASDVIWREVILAKKVKPVVASMGDVAASGGYYISCAANKIVASQNTITGSIGVFGVLFNGKKMFNNKLGITFDTINTNTHADLGSIARPLTAEETAIIQNSVENIYDVFISHVGEGRKMTKASIDSIGQGRVWSGLDAKNIGLVDEFGGLNYAIDLAAKLSKTDKYRVVSLPVQKDPFEELLSDFSGGTKAYLLRNELGENFKYYKHLQDIIKHDGIQMWMPYGIEVY